MYLPQVELSQGSLVTSDRNPRSNQLRKEIFFSDLILKLKVQI